MDALTLIGLVSLLGALWIVRQGYLILQAKRFRAQSRQRIKVWIAGFLQADGPSRYEYLQHTPIPLTAFLALESVDQSWAEIVWEIMQEMVIPAEIIESFRDPITPVDPDLYDVMGNWLTLATISGALPQPPDEDKDKTVQRSASYWHEPRPAAAEKRRQEQAERIRAERERAVNE